MKLNKKAEISVGIILLLVALGVISIAVIKPELFSTFIPPIGPVETRGLVNPLYYDVAGGSPSFACDMNPIVLFRTRLFIKGGTDDNSIWSNNKEIAIYKGGDRLVNLIQSSHLLLSAGKTCSQSSIGFTSYGYSYGGWEVGYYSPKKLDALCRVFPTSTDVHYFSLGGSISTSLIPEDPSLETLSEPKPVLSQNYVCENNNIVLKTCGDGTSVVQQQCELGCKFFDSYNVGSRVVPAVKCNGDYKPNRQVCVGNTKYITNADGSSINSEQCVVCTQVIPETQARCDECVLGEEKCVGNQPSVCINGKFQPESGINACIGLQSCNVLNGNAQCLGGCNEGQLGCSPDNTQQTQCNTVTQTMDPVKNCDAGCSNGQCKPILAGGPGTYCLGDSVVGCTGDCLDNSDLISPVSCTSKKCQVTSSNTASCTPFCDTSKNICDTDVYYCVTDLSNKAGGGVSKGNIKTDCDNALGCKSDSNGVAICSTSSECLPPNGLSCRYSSEVWSCDSFGLYKSKQKTCDNGCINGACKYVIPEGPGSFCRSNGIIDTCANDCLDNIDLSSMSCQSGQCTSNPAKCTPICSLGKVCGKNVPGVGGEFLYECISSTNPSTGDRTVRLTTECPNGCDESTNKCVELPECVGKEGSYICKSGNSVKCSSDGTTIVEQNVCSSSGCDSLTGRCRTECTPGVNLCYTDGNVYSCDITGKKGSLVNTCESTLGCERNSQGIGVCKTSNVCVPNTQGNACQGQFVRKCTSFGTFGTQVSDCGSIGCNTGTGECNTECTTSQVGSFSCKPDGNSYLCNPELKLVLDNSCSEGCDSSTGKCIVGEKACGQVNERVCLEDGNSYKCDSSLNLVLENDCSPLGCNNGYCISQCNPSLGRTCYDPANLAQDYLGNSEKQIYGDVYECKQLPQGGNNGIINLDNKLDDCVASCTNSECELICPKGVLYCENNNWFKCADDGKSKSVFEQCSFGCISGLGCEYLTIELDKTNFAITDVLEIGFKLTREKEPTKPINDETFSAILKDEGDRTAFSGSGNIINSIGTIKTSSIFLPGKYKLNISIIDSTLSQIFDIRVTTDVKIERASETTIYTTQTEPVTIRILENGELADVSGLIIDPQSGNITVKPTPSATKGIWDLEIKGKPGIYTLLITPTRIVGGSTVELSQNTLPIDLKTPTLKVTLDLPISEKKPYKLDRDIEFRGIKNELLKPDLVEVELTKPDNSISILSTTYVSGIYNIQTDMTDMGIYTLMVHAEKIDYDPVDITKTIEITSSGSPSGGGGGGGTGNVTGQPPAPTEGKNYTLWILIGIGVIFLVWYIRKR